jgi:hypothetical protein
LEEEKCPYHFAGKYGAEWLLKLQTTFWNVSQAFLFGDKSVSPVSGGSIEGNDAQRNLSMQMTSKWRP